MSGEVVSSVDPLLALHKSWQVQLDSSHAALVHLHHRCEEAASTHHSLDAFTSSLFAIERRALLEQIHCLCRDKLALKQHITDLRKDRSRDLHHQSDTSSALLALSQSHLPTDNGIALSSPPPISATASLSSLSTPLTSSSIPASSLLSSSSTDLLLRSEVDDLRSQVVRLRAERQSILSALHQRETELEAAEHSLRRLSKERERLVERLREMEERAMGQLEANAAMSEVVRRGVEKERRWMEERAEIEREMERMGSDTMDRRGGDGRTGTAAHGYGGVEAGGQRLHPLQQHGVGGAIRYSTQDSEDSDQDTFDSTSRADSIDDS